MYDPNSILLPTHESPTINFYARKHGNVPYEPVVGLVNNELNGMSKNLLLIINNIPKSSEVTFTITSQEDGFKICTETTSPNRHYAYKATKNKDVYTFNSLETTTEKSEQIFLISLFKKYMLSKLSFVQKFCRLEISIDKQNKILDTLLMIRSHKFASESNNKRKNKIALINSISIPPLLIGPFYPNTFHTYNNPYSCKTSQSASTTSQCILPTDSLKKCTTKNKSSSNQKKRTRASVKEKGPDTFSPPAKRPRLLCPPGTIDPKKLDKRTYPFPGNFISEGQLK
ncbi:MAG: hypothetical protein VX777_10235 [Chlamydiota bacterium]|nr:hypothetical protein [Chlamydiota bacterium]